MATNVAVRRRRGLARYGSPPLIVVTILLFLLATPLPVLAQCNPMRLNYSGSVFAGAANVGGISPFEGRADIEQYAPYVQPNGGTHDNQVQTWVMLNVGNKWAQLGWKQIVDPLGNPKGRWNWAQGVYNDGSLYDKLFSSAATQGTITHYRLARQAAGPPGTGWLWTFYVNGSAQPSPPNLGTWTPDTAEWHGETNTYNSQMPGATGNHVTISLAQWRDGSGLWHDANTAKSVSAQGFGFNPDLTDFHASKVNSNTYDIWDSKCSL